MVDKEGKERPSRPFALRTVVEEPKAKSKKDSGPKAKSKKDSVKISSAKHPAPQSTLFDLGVSVEVTGESSDLSSSVIVHPIEPGTLKGIDPSTVKFFRFDKRANAWQPVWNSGLNQEMGYAWAKVREPGTYILSGLPQDGVIRELLRAVAYKRLYEGSNTPNDAKALTDDVFAILQEVIPNELHELRRRMTVIDVQRRGIYAEEEVIRGDGGAIQPFPLPGGVHFEDLGKRLQEVKPLASGFPEEALFFSPQIIEADSPVEEEEPELELELPGKLSPTFELPFERDPEPPWLSRLNALDHIFKLDVIPKPSQLFCSFFSRNWWTYHHDVHLSGVARCSNINSTNVGGLKKKHDPLLDGPIISIPAVVNNRIYVGTGNSSTAASSSGGTLYKIKLNNGAIEKTFTFNTTPGEGSRQGFAGIGCSPAVTGGRVYFSGLDGKLYCLNSGNLALIWVTDLRNFDAAHNQPVSHKASAEAEGWSSPLVVNGRVYVGFGEGESDTFGFVYCLDAKTGNVIWIFCTNKFGPGNNAPNVIPASVVGGPLPPGFSSHANPPEKGASPWSSCCYNSELDRVYIGTGNAIPDGPLPEPNYSNGCLSLDATTGAFKGFFQPSVASSYKPIDADVDVPAGPMLFRRDGELVLGIGSKNGSFFLLNPDTMALLAQRQLLPYDSMGNPFPNIDPFAASENMYGVFGTASVHSGLKRLYIGLGGYSSSIDSTTTPFMRVVDWNTLADAWTTAGTNPPKYTAPVPPMYTTAGEAGLSSPAIVNDVVFISTTMSRLYAFDAATGLNLWASPSVGGSFYMMGPAIYRKNVVVGSQNGRLYIYSI